MFINATLNISNAVVKVLPEDAVVRFEKKEYIFVVKGKEQFEALPVITGKRSSGFVQIISTIDSAANTMFVTKNAFTLLSVWKNVAEE